MILFLLAACGSDAGVKIYNSPPTSSIQSPADGSNFDEATPVIFEGVAADDQTAGNDLVVIWQSDIGGVLQADVPADVSGLTTFETAALAIGNHTISLSVADEQGELAKFSVVVTINDVPDNPEISLVHPAGGEYVNEAEDFHFVITATDKQDASIDLVTSFYSDIDGEFCAPQPDELGVAQCTAQLSGGHHHLRITVTDLDGYTAVAEWLFPVTYRTQIDDDGDGFTEEEGDCNDADIYSYPGGFELEDGADNDCDTVVDEWTNAYDDDGDGASENGGDCDDTTTSIGLTATETCNGIDDNCDGILDVEDSASCTNYYYDYDGDGYGSSSVSPKCLCAIDGYYTSGYSNDCYDYNASASPAASAYSTTHRGDGSYDWNCNGTETKYYTVSGGCGSWPGCGYTDGWSGSTPACGSTSSWVNGCHVDWFSCDEDTVSLTQSCI